MSDVGRLTASELRDLQRDGCPAHLIQKLLEAYRVQRMALEIVQQYLTMFSEGEGTVDDVGALASDLRDAIQDGQSQGDVVGSSVCCPRCGAFYHAARSP